MAEDEVENGDGCSRCGRPSDSVTLKELGGWIVGVDSTLMCPDCAATRDEKGSTGRTATRRTA